jgi:hypothetical protein
VQPYKYSRDGNGLRVKGGLDGTQGEEKMAFRLGGEGVRSSASEIGDRVVNAVRVVAPRYSGANGAHFVARGWKMEGRAVVHAGVAGRLARRISCAR